jgi:hypothetical protein
MKTLNSKTTKKHGYAPINELKMYYEIEGTGDPLVFIPPAFGIALAVIPSASHFVLYSEQERVIPIVKHFLEKPEKGLPLATAETGYHPGETR